MSKKDEWFVQARLERKTENSLQNMVSWIPESIALPGKHIRLKQDDGSWTENWLVVNRGETKITRKKAATLAHGSKNFKENSDI